MLQSIVSYPSSSSSSCSCSCSILYNNNTTKLTLNDPLPFLFNVLGDMLDSKSYLVLLRCNTKLRKTKTRKDIRLNSAFDLSRLLNLIVEQKANIFLTGEAGTGKTYSVNTLIKLFETMKMKYKLTATTGRACTNYTECVTLHSFSGLGKGTAPIDQIRADFASYAQKHGDNTIPPRYRRWQEIEYLIIDEVSMLGKRFIEKLDLVARRSRHCSKPFGGVKIIFVGDLLQLPPVGDKFVFESEIWSKLKLEYVYLTHVYRQLHDPEYLHLLSRIRRGISTESDMNFLIDNANNYREEKKEREDLEALQFLKASRIAKQEEEKEIIVIDDNENEEDHELFNTELNILKTKPIHLTSFHVDCDRINLQEFGKIRNSIIESSSCVDTVLERVVNGEKTVLRPTSRASVSEALVKIGKYIENKMPQMVEFKIGAQYVLTRNINIARKQINGSICFYDVIDNPDQPGTQIGVVKFSNINFIRLEDLLHSHVQAVFGMDNIYLRRVQYSLRLGYALTIHGSQGMTLEEAEIDLSRKSARFAGAAYVALSRVKSRQGLHLVNFDPKAIRVHEKAKLEDARILNKITRQKRKEQEKEIALEQEKQEEEQQQKQEEEEQNKIIEIGSNSRRKRARLQ